MTHSCYHCSRVCDSSSALKRASKLYISTSVARPRFPSWSSSIHCLVVFSSDQDSLPFPLLHLSSFSCSHFLSLSHLPLSLSLIRRRSARTLSLQGDQLPLSIVSKSHDLVLSGLVSTSLAKSPIRHAHHRPKSGRRFSDRYIKTKIFPSWRTKNHPE